MKKVTSQVITFRIPFKKKVKNFKLDSKKSYELISEKFSQQDVVYSEHNVGNNAIDDSLCDWTICYNLDSVIVKKLTQQDADLYEQYLAELEEQM